MVVHSPLDRKNEQDPPNPPTPFQPRPFYPSGFHSPRFVRERRQQLVARGCCGSLWGWSFGGWMQEREKRKPGADQKKRLKSQGQSILPLLFSNTLIWSHFVSSQAFFFTECVAFFGKLDLSSKGLGGKDSLSWSAVYVPLLMTHVSTLTDTS